MSTELAGILEQKVVGSLVDHVVTVGFAAPSIVINNSGGGSVNPATQNFTNQTQVQVLHNRGYRPTVTITDLNGDEVTTDVDHTSANEFYVRFAAPSSGTINYI